MGGKSMGALYLSPQHSLSAPSLSRECIPPFALGLPKRVEYHVEKILRLRNQSRQKSFVGLYWSLRPQLFMTMRAHSFPTFFRKDLRTSLQWVKRYRTIQTQTSYRCWLGSYHTFDRREKSVAVNSEVG